MKQAAKIFLPILILFAGLPAAFAQSGPARTQLDHFSRELESLHAGFEQKVTNAQGVLADQSSGEVWLLSPNRFRWAYGGDFPELIVADGRKIWIYDELLEQVTVRDQASLGSDSPLTLLTDLSRLDDQFDVRELGDDSGLQLLELRAKNPEAEFERVLLGLKDNDLRLMAMEDAFGFRTEIRFKDAKRNEAVDTSLFQFIPPENADVIGDFPVTAKD